MENEELMTSESQRSRQNGRSADRADVGNLSAKDRLSQLRMGGGELTTSELRRSKEEAGVLICWVWTGPESNQRHMDFQDGREPKNCSLLRPLATFADFSHPRC